MNIDIKSVFSRLENGEIVSLNKENDIIQQITYHLDLFYDKFYIGFEINETKIILTPDKNYVRKSIDNILTLN